MTDGAVYCNRCGAQNSALAKFCSNCGTPFSSEVQPHATTAISPRPQSPAFPPPSDAPAVPAIRYGGFWLRFVAVIIDGLLVGMVVWPVSAIIGLIVGIAGGSVGMPMTGVHLVGGIVRSGLFFFTGWIYEAAMESSAKQATVGKMALALKVTDLQGQRVSFARATGRHFAKIISKLTLLIGYIMAGFTQRKQALHDMIAGTLVMRTQ
jgi:uncharacterized RDD family membrane protein YckC